MKATVKKDNINVHILEIDRTTEHFLLQIGIQ